VGSEKIWHTNKLPKIQYDDRNKQKNKYVGGKYIKRIYVIFGIGRGGGEVKKGHQSPLTTQSLGQFPITADKVK
jgi:hypothetical protein